MDFKIAVILLLAACCLQEIQAKPNPSVFSSKKTAKPETAIAPASSSKRSLFDRWTHKVNKEYNKAVKYVEGKTAKAMSMIKNAKQKLSEVSTKAVNSVKDITESAIKSWKEQKIADRIIQITQDIENKAREVQQALDEAVENSGQASENEMLKKVDEFVKKTSKKVAASTGLNQKTTDCAAEAVLSLGKKTVAEGAKCILSKVADTASLVGDITKVIAEGKDIFLAGKQVLRKECTTVNMNCAKKLAPHLMNAAKLAKTASVVFAQASVFVGTLELSLTACTTIAGAKIALFAGSLPSELKNCLLD